MEQLTVSGKWARQVVGKGAARERLGQRQVGYGRQGRLSEKWREATGDQGTALVSETYSIGSTQGTVSPLPRRL